MDRLEHSADILLSSFTETNASRLSHSFSNALYGRQGNEGRGDEGGHHSEASELEVRAVVRVLLLCVCCCACAAVVRVLLLSSLRAIFY